MPRQQNGFSFQAKKVFLTYPRCDLCVENWVHHMDKGQHIHVDSAEEHWDEQFDLEGAPSEYSSCSPSVVIRLKKAILSVPMFDRPPRRILRHVSLSVTSFSQSIDISDRKYVLYLNPNACILYSTLVEREKVLGFKWHSIPLELRNGLSYVVSLAKQIGEITR